MPSPETGLARVRRAAPASRTGERERSGRVLALNRARARMRTLSALRVVLADLRQRGTTAEEVDLRFDQQVIVRPVPQKTGETPRTS